MQVREEVELKMVAMGEALRSVGRYVEDHPGCYTSDIVLSLGLEPSLVLKALEKLEKTGRVYGKGA